MSEVENALNQGGGPSPTPSPAPTPTPSPAPTPAPSPTPAPTPAPSPTPEPSGDRWQDKFLPSELQGDETLARYGSIEDLAKGHIQTQQWARGRIAIPNADNPQSFEDFAGKLRPAEPKDYAIVDREGKASAFGEAMAPLFHKAGLHPMQAKILNDGWNQYEADTVSAQAQQGKAELNAIEFQMGAPAYNQRLQAVENMFAAAGIENVGDIATSLEQAIGAGNTMKFLFSQAERTGELSKVDGLAASMRAGTGTAADAQARLDEMSRNPDKEYQAKLATPGTPEHQQRRALLARVAKGD